MRSPILIALAVLLLGYGSIDAEEIQADDQGSITSFTIVGPQGPVTHNTEGGPTAGYVFLPISYSLTDYYADFHLGSIAPGSITAAALDLSIVSDPAYANMGAPDRVVELNLLYNPLTVSPGTDPSQFNNLNSGDVIGSIPIPLDHLDNEHVYHVDFNSQGIEDLNTASGEITLSGTLESIGSSQVNSYLVDIDQPTLDLTLSVPEPSTWALLVGGILSLVGFHRFRRKSQNVGFQG